MCDNKYGKNYTRRDSLRLKDFEYKNGTYHITLCSKDEKCIFGWVEKKEYPEVRLSHYGKIVENRINNIEEIKLSVIMPNHVHMLVHIPCDERERELAAILRQLKSSTSRDAGEKLWQRSYYDVIIRDEKHLDNAIQYILNNPHQWANDVYFKKSDIDKFI